MGKAEVGSVKHLNKMMKQKGLTRLRWYCQLCEKPCRDENGFKMHTQSPSHMAKAVAAGENFKSVQEDFSKQFLRDFIQLLKTSHGEKDIHINRFYQEVIANRDHVHLNATKWHSLTDFAKYLGKESICRVELKDEDGIFISWIDDSSEAIKRRDAIRRKEQQEKGDEVREQAMLKAQMRRAREIKGKANEEEDTGAKILNREECEKVTFLFRTKAGPSSGEKKVMTSLGKEEGISSSAADALNVNKPSEDKPASEPMAIKFNAKPPHPRNVFKTAFSGGSKKKVIAAPPKMSEAERIMKEELERKRARDQRGPSSKKMRF